jgi:transposase InsO family protein
VKSHRSQYSIQLLCTKLNVSRAGFYKWLTRGISNRAVKRQKLLIEIKSIHDESRGNYGSPRIGEALKKRGLHRNHKTIERVMKQNGIKAKTRRRFKVTTDSKHNLPVAENILSRQFKTEQQDQCWVSDITYIPTAEGWLYLAVFIDLYSRKVLGWSMSSLMTAEFVLNALRMAIARRGHRVNPLIHSDRGSQYASDLFTAELKLRSCKQSMSRKGNCWDNAVAESFFSTLKTELVHQEKFESRQEAQAKIFDYVEVFYNKQRLHSTLNYMTPEEFEMLNKKEEQQAA